MKRKKPFRKGRSALKVAHERASACEKEKEGEGEQSRAKKMDAFAPRSMETVKKDSAKSRKPGGLELVKGVEAGRIWRGGEGENLTPEKGLNVCRWMKKSKGQKKKSNPEHRTSKGSQSGSDWESPVVYVEKIRIGKGKEKRRQENWEKKKEERSIIKGHDLFGLLF